MFILKLYSYSWSNLIFSLAGPMEADVEKVQADAWLWVLPLPNSFLGIEFSGVVDKMETYGEEDIILCASDGSVSFLRLSLLLVDACNICRHESFHWDDVLSFLQGHLPLPQLSLLQRHLPGGVDMSPFIFLQVPTSATFLDWSSHQLVQQLPGHSQPICVHLSVELGFFFMLWGLWGVGTGA